MQCPTGVVVGLPEDVNLRSNTLHGMRTTKRTGSHYKQTALHPLSLQGWEPMASGQSDRASSRSVGYPSKTHVRAVQKEKSHTITWQLLRYAATVLPLHAALRPCCLCVGVELIEVLRHELLDRCRQIWPVHDCPPPSCWGGQRRTAAPRFLPSAQCTLDHNCSA